jgi:hypothetical protein
LVFILQFTKKSNQVTLGMLAGAKTGARSGCRANGGIFGSGSVAFHTLNKIFYSA